MMEYMFFDAALRDRFVEKARELGVDCQLKDDSMGLVVGVPENLREPVEAELEACYDTLQVEEASRVDRSEGGLQKHLAGFRVELPDGRTTQVALPPSMASRLLECFSLEEIQTLFAAVARRALHPEDAPLCRTKPDM